MSLEPCGAKTNARRKPTWIKTQAQIGVCFEQTSLYEQMSAEEIRTFCRIPRENEVMIRFEASAIPKRSRNVSAFFCASRRPR